MARTYESKLRLAGIVGIAGALGAGVIAGRLVRLGEPGEHFWIVFPLLLVLGALALLSCLPWWRRADDVQRGEHLASWYWGGMGGGIFVLMGLVAAVSPRHPAAGGGGHAAGLYT